METAIEYQLECRVCKGKHTEKEVGNIWDAPICPTTKKKLVYISWWKEEVNNSYFVLDTNNHFGNNIHQLCKGTEIIPTAYVLKEDIFYCTLHNHGVSNTCILFTKDKRYVVADWENKIIESKDLSQSQRDDLEEVIENSFLTFNVYPEGKNIYGKETNNTYLIVRNMKWALPDLMKIYFNEHTTICNEEAFMEAVKILNV